MKKEIWKINSGITDMTEYIEVVKINLAYSRLEILL